jgi:cytoskeletal protein CcmA (bactofilin family)
MSISNLKSKVVSIVQNNSSNDNSISKKLEVISSNFRTTPTIIARDLKIEGEIVSLGIIEIEGNIKGTLRGNSVILREECLVEGTIIAEVLSIRGRFDGMIKAKHISIASKAEVIGTIEYGSLSVEDGASVDGQFRKMEISK